VYVHGFPLVDSYRIQYSYFVDRGGPEYKTPWNQIWLEAVSFAPSGSEVPVDGAPERIADSSQTGEVVKQPGSVTTDPSASPATPGVPPGRLKGDSAREPLSRYQRISLALNAAALVISALGFTAVIVSIRTAQGQMSYVAAQTRVMARDRSLSNVLTLHRVFLDQPELRPYFFEGKDLEESHALYPKVEAVADMHLDMFAYNLDYRLVFPDDYRRPEGYKRYIRSRLALSPVMRRRLEKKGEWFSPYLQEMLK
jgi:hypothetical protein